MNGFVLTWSLAVVRVDDEDADEEEQYASPHDFPEQRATTRACTQQGVDRKCDGCAHYEHKPGGEKKKSDRV